jgi:hypothetical protein
MEFDHMFSGSPKTAKNNSLVGLGKTLSSYAFHFLARLKLFNEDDDYRFVLLGYFTYLGGINTVHATRVSTVYKPRVSLMLFLPTTRSSY